jgi:hypothetical protein
VAERRRLVAGVVFAAVTLLACVLLARRLTDSSWPFAHARMLLVGVAALCYFVSFVLRARGWRRLFPRGECPGQARCLASVGAAAASGIVLPFRLDYLVKIASASKRSRSRSCRWEWSTRSRCCRSRSPPPQPARPISVGR